MSNLKTLGFVLVSVLFLGGCNTTRGIGQDIEAAGETIEDAAEETKENMRID